MKAFKIIFATLAATAVLAGCAKEITSPSFENDKVNPEGTRVIAVSFAPQTKTELDGFQPKFVDNDSILISNGVAIDTCDVEVEGNVATISTNLTGPLTAVYPYKAAKMSGSNPKQIDTVLVSTVQSGKFADANICMAKMTDEKDESLSFENKTAVFCIYPPTDNPEYVEVSAEGFEIANDVPTGSTHTSLETIHVNTTTADSVWVSILVPEGLKVGDLTFSDGTNVKTVTGDKASTEITAGTLYTVNKEGWENPEADIPDGALKGVFTVGKGADGIAGTADDVKVYFSQGNLQAKYNGNSYTWGFAANQYDYIGNAAGNTTIDSQTNGADVDLFGWSTSTNGTSTTDNYGIKTSISSGDYSGDFYDWGKAYCASKSISPDNTWHTLTKDEWGYLFGMELNGEYYVPYVGHPRADKLGLATVNNVPGLVLLPDSWNLPSGCEFTPTALDGDNKVTDAKNFSLNIYTVDQWNRMESAGAVFLPAAGDRDGSNVFNVGDNGYYWSSTACDEKFASSVYFLSDSVSPDYGRRYRGYSVRLVTDVSAAPAPTQADGTRGELNGHDYVVVAGIKWATQNLAITEPGNKKWKGGNTSSAVKVPGTNEDVIVGDYFQWGAYAGYCGESTAADKGLLIYNSFINTKCVGVTGTDSFEFKNADESNKYRFTLKGSTGCIGISPHYSLGYQHYTDSDHYSTLFREATYTGHNDDVANIILGDNWRMPTSAEFDALIKATYWAWDGTDCGYYVFKPGQGTNGNANEQGTIDTYTDDKSAALLFFPAAGQGVSKDFDLAGSAGIYWSSSLYTDDKDYAYVFGFLSDELFLSQYNDFRDSGCSVRPVSE